MDLISPPHLFEEDISKRVWPIRTCAAGEMDEFTFSKESKRLRMTPSKLHRGEFKKTIQEGTLKIEDVCLGCLEVSTDLKSHPIFKGGICATCTESLKLAITGNEVDPLFCIVCGVEKDSVHCYNEHCQGVFCKTCINDFCFDEAWSQILHTKKWLCFLCTVPVDHVYLVKQENWEINVLTMFHRKTEKMEIPSTSKPKPIRVLSLFDGIGAGYAVLQKLGISVEEYFASEIDEAAIRISSANSGGKVKQLGEVCSLTRGVLKSILPIDILLGGSPCTELSLVNPARRGLFDINATGILFFEYIRILRELHELSPGKTILYLFENTAAMPRAYRDTISRFFECEPVLLDANLFSPMKRARFFWGNIPGMGDIPFGASPADVRLGTYLTTNCNRTPFVNHIRTITTNSNSLRQGAQRILPVVMDGEEDSLWINEIETIFGFKEHYTDIGNLPTSKRLSLIGSSWSIPVICHLLRKLTLYFEVNRY